jgi:putative transposase
MIRDDDFARHVDHLHHNPRQARRLRIFDWRWSSIHAYAGRGIIAADWRGREQDGSFGD